MSDKLLPVATAPVRGFGPALPPGNWLYSEGSRLVARILAVTVAYESDAPGDLQPTLIGLRELRQYCRAERVELRGLHRARSCPSSGVAGDARAT
jgi:hypothetical protein